MVKNNNGREIYQRLAVLETKVDEIIDNHLAHLDKRMGRIEARQTQILVGIVGTLVAVIASFVLGS